MLSETLMSIGTWKTFIAIRDWFHITPGVQKKRGITVHEACKDTFGRLSYNPWTGTLLCFFTRAHGVGQVLLITLVLIGLPCGTTLCNCLQCLHKPLWTKLLLKCLNCSHSGGTKLHCDILAYWKEWHTGYHRQS